MTQSQEAARWMVLMEAGLACVDEIVRWADEKIVATDKPHPALIEISTSDDKAFRHVFDHLKELRPDVDRFEALRFAAPTLRAAIENETKHADGIATFTFNYLSGEHFQIPPDMRFLYSAYDEFYLAVVEGRGSRESVEQEFIIALKNAAIAQTAQEPTPRIGTPSANRGAE